MRRFLFVSLVLAGLTSTWAQVTPLDQPLVEETLIPITCELTKAPSRSELPKVDTFDLDKIPGTYHYNLWLPKGYLADPARRWPCAFIASPSGNAKLGQMGDALAARGYVVVLLVEAKNGPWEPIFGNFLAAHDDVIQRVRVEDGSKLATGFSGGARASSCFVQMRPGFSGLILQGAGGAFDDKGKYHVEPIKRGPIRVALLMGDTDKNNNEVARMEKELPGAQCKVFPFAGKHQWAPAAEFAQALEFVQGR